MSRRRWPNHHASTTTRRRAGRPLHERPAQAASQVTRIRCDSRGFQKDDSHEPLSDIPGTIQTPKFGVARVGKTGSRLIRTVTVSVTASRRLLWPPSPRGSLRPWREWRSPAPP